MQNLYLRIYKMKVTKKRKRCEKNIKKNNSLLIFKDKIIEELTNLRMFKTRMAFHCIFFKFHLDSIIFYFSFTLNTNIIYIIYNIYNI